MTEEQKKDAQNTEEQKQEQTEQTSEEKQEVSQKNQSAEETKKSEEVNANSDKSENKSEEEPQSRKEEEKTQPQSEIKEEPKQDPTDWAVPQEEFDWADKSKTDDVYSDDEMEKMKSIYDDTLSTISENEVIDGTVVSIGKREVVVNIGYKSEAVISKNEFRYNPDLKPGDKVEVLVETLEDTDGQLMLSHRKARSLRSWERVNAAYENDEIIKGFVKCRTKGGMIVDVFGIEAFLPGSQIDVKPIRDYDQFVEKTMEFKVVKINQEYKNVVVSHKALIEEELEAQKKDIIAKLEKGQVLEGTVKNITSYGVFIDLGGVDGLIHITDLSWGRVQHPEEIVKLDEKIQVVILDFDDDKRRIALGLKQLTPHPWDSLDPNLKVGDKVKGKVVVMADYGAFVEIAPGVEGLIHVSEMSWSQHLRSAQEFMNVGDEVEAVILTLDRDERKMSLGIKQLYPDPWEKIEEKYPISSKHTAKVRNFTNFGIFVELEEGVDGLIHISDLSWTKKIKHPAEFTQIGEEIEVVVLEVDKENRRLSLGHKQLEENPWDVFETIFNVGSIHEGTITELTNKGAVVSLPYGVEGFVTPKHLVKEDGTQAKAEEKLNFKVIEFNKEAKKIFVSHSRIHEDEEKAKKDEERKAKQKSSKDTSKKIDKMKEKIERTTLGDVSDLSDLKDQLRETEQKEQEEKVKEAKAKMDTKEADSKTSESEEKEETAKEETAKKETEKKSSTTAKKSTSTAKKTASKTKGSKQTTEKKSSKSATGAAKEKDDSAKDVAKKDEKEKKDAEKKEEKGSQKGVKAESKKEESKKEEKTESKKEESKEEKTEEKKGSKKKSSGTTKKASASKAKSEKSDKKDSGEKEKGKSEKDSEEK